MLHKYIRLEHANPDNKDWFVVNWCLGNTCNYACSYCPSGLHDGSKGWPELEIIKNFILKVKNHYTNKKLYFEFTGGEVTVYKHFIELAEFCKEQDVKIGLISNGSRTIRYWEENKHLFDHVCLSFHPEFADGDHFKNVVKAVHKTLKTHVNIMMSPEKFDYCLELAKEISELGDMSMALQPLIHDFGDTLYDYTSEQKEVFDNQYKIIQIKNTTSFKWYRGAMKAVFPNGEFKLSGAHQFISRKINNWDGWNCYAGLEQLIVDMDGSAYRGWCKVGGAIGKISDPNFKFPEAPILCNKTMCHCNFDIMCTKEK